mmetsp:Transcript_104814/g.291916  ORF Transcript_104814/g.291916 Transcript_104814/m.291916 type:complete len:241 (+) Transcript_104814:110-832(+)|eukprot:CAMPEP_0179149560 /NCGR_PEP_ID=MMETSP0796-20121207/72463_1 /TAXON_ID=73915 /ORGANISM="Pyrodinium bahamense, Strain pbaha01" /LENGTH=240 /DNA_ID=CAMNT_0020850415 /DNA_START=48 /DNA_END=770 /DNA_ORIENTATION=-
MAAASSTSDAAASGKADAGEDNSTSESATAANASASSSTQPYGSTTGMGGMYGSPYGGMYGRSMYGGYGGGMYGGYGGMYGGMGGMYGMGGGSSYADSMFRMTQMLEMNSIMLDQLQEHVSMTYNRFRDVVSWLWALKDLFRPEQPAEAQQVPQQCFESEAAKREALQRVRRRIRVLLVLMALFAVLVLRDSRRQARDLEVDGAWMKAAEGLLPAPGGSALALPPMGPGSPPRGPGASFM